MIYKLLVAVDAIAAGLLALSFVCRRWSDELLIGATVIAALIFLIVAMGRFLNL